MLLHKTAVFSRMRFPHTQTLVHLAEHSHHTSKTRTVYRSTHTLAVEFGDSDNALVALVCDVNTFGRNMFRIPASYHHIRLSLAAWREISGDTHNTHPGWIIETIVTPLHTQRAHCYAIRLRAHGALFARRFAFGTGANANLSRSGSKSLTNGGCYSRCVVRCAVVCILYSNDRVENIEHTVVRAFASGDKIFSSLVAKLAPS